MKTRLHTSHQLHLLGNPQACISQFLQPCPDTPYEKFAEVGAAARAIGQHNKHCSDPQLVHDGLLDHDPWALSL